MTDPRLLQYELDIDGVDPVEFRITGFRVTEALFDGYRVVVDAVSRSAMDPESLLAKTATFHVRSDADTDRPFHGVVLVATVDAARADVWKVHVEIGARIELLKLGRNARMYQDKSVRDVVTAVLHDAGLDTDMVWHTRTTYAPREYIVQYAESDFAFVQRLLCEEGIGFMVHNRPDADEIQFFDDNTALEPIDGVTTLTHRDTTQFGEHTVTDLQVRRTAASDATMVRDYDFKHPALDLSARDHAEHATGREVYRHHARFADVATGRRRAKRLLESLRVGVNTFRGKSDCPQLAPGHTFSVAGHARAEMNTDLIVQSITHVGFARSDADGATVTYENEFVAIPKAVTYRPVAAPPAPALGGVQLAAVTVPPGEEIHADRFGRVKVRFPWDRSGVTDDRSSTWLRVGQLALGGSMILPRHDFEVIVDFELGDIDRPFVTGHLYNGQYRVPYGLPGAKTRSSIQTATTSSGPGANELRFEDAAGAEEMMINASKDYNALVDNDSATTVGGSETVNIGSNHTLSVGTDHTAAVAASRTLSVSGPQDVNVAGAYSDGVGGSATMSIGGMRHVKVGGDHAENCSGTLSRTVSALQCVTGIAGYDRKIVGDSKVTVGAAWMEIAGGSRMSSCKAGRSELVGALKMVRAKTITVSAGTLLTTNAAAKKVNAGANLSETADGLIAVQAGGGMSVKATNITITAENQMAIIAGATMIRLTSGGTVTVKAPQIDLTGVKALNQIMHKSG